MKNLFLMIAMLFIATSGYAQSTNNFDATRTGKSFVGINTSNLGFQTVDKVTSAQGALEVGTFVADNFALVGSVGLASKESEKLSWTYSGGAKYYIASKFPLQFDYNGFVNSMNKEAFVGLQLGYAWMPWKNISIEPRVRQDWALGKLEPNKFSGGVGVNLHF